MESYSKYQRSPQRRTASSEQSQPQLPMASGSNTAIAMMGGGAAGEVTAGRTSSGSAKSAAARATPDKQLSQIEKSVTHLLVATKELLETLTQWSRGQATEVGVSDVYVRLGYEFNLACRAFQAIGVDTTDLGPVPDLLRTILEDTLSQDASPQSLDRYLPRIRDIIISLLHGLKRKQARLRSRQARGLPPRQGSQGSVAASGETAVPPPMDEALSQRQPQDSRQTTPLANDPAAMSSRNTSSNWPAERQGATFSEREAMRREVQRSMPPSVSSSSISSSTMQNMPVLQPYDQDSSRGRSASPASNSQMLGFPPPPPPPPKTNDAIGMLQRSGELERRASRRFSAYQIQKHLGSTNGVPVLPSSPSSQIVSRGRDVRESMNAVRLRGTAHSRQKPSNQRPADPTKSPANSEISAKTRAEPRSEPAADDSPTAKIPTDKGRSARAFENREASIIDKGVPNLPQIRERDSLPEEADQGIQVDKRETENGELKTASMDSDNSRPAQFTPEMSPPPPSSKELTLFLQYKSKIKKYVLAEGYTGLTIGRLQLAFIEKFAWNTHNNGVDLPEIYIQDPVSGVRHELEDLSDVKDRCVLVLNVEALDEVKKHIDESVGGIRRLVEGVRDTMDNQATSIQLLTDRQQEATKEIARLAATPTSVPSTSGQSLSSSDKGGYVAELQILRRDLAVLRQTYSNFSSDISASMNHVRTKAGVVKTAAADLSVPTYKGDAGRARINAGKKELADESEKLVARVDDLQDLVEDLRKDVVTRGVRPLPRQLEAVGRDISAVTKELKKMQDFLKREKPIWTKIWEKELQQVCEERDQLTMQEDLAVDLEDDLEKATQTFALVEQATKQQALQSSNGDGNAPVTFRVPSRTLPLDSAVDPVKAKDSVLGEVRALQPNHENRVEAIERAEKARQKELENRRVGQFQKELGAFVEEGKLKKSGGFEEAERLRKAKDEKIRKEVWERMQGLNPGETEPASQASGAELPTESGAPKVPNTEEDERPGDSEGNDEIAARRASGADRLSADAPGTSGQDEQRQ
ncbi:Bud site selection protein 6 [Emydomyces testavorans]|uniref:Bud site selection protein 6 n=1 Tax=Emydomyces testavorans TaxID=2070801 RepID=A0AAF0IGI1_9EURO|nr:Bud site selection protein 6 [Emydomyces testavorans]